MEKIEQHFSRRVKPGTDQQTAYGDRGAIWVTSRTVDTAVPKRVVISKDRRFVFQPGEVTFRNTKLGLVVICKVVSVDGGAPFVSKTEVLRERPCRVAVAGLERQAITLSMPEVGADPTHQVVEKGGVAVYYRPPERSFRESRNEFLERVRDLYLDAWETGKRVTPAVIELFDPGIRYADRDQRAREAIFQARDAGLLASHEELHRKKCRDVARAWKAAERRGLPRNAAVAELKYFGGDKARAAQWIKYARVLKMIPEPRSLS